MTNRRLVYYNGSAVNCLSAADGSVLWSHSIKASTICADQRYRSQSLYQADWQTAKGSDCKLTSLAVSPQGYTAFGYTSMYASRSTVTILDPEGLPAGDFVDVGALGFQWSPDGTKLSLCYANPPDTEGLNSAYTSTPKTQALRTETQCHVLDVFGSEQNQLSRLFRASGGSQWTSTTKGWQPGSGLPICEWDGITCLAGSRGGVVKLELPRCVFRQTFWLHAFTINAPFCSTDLAHPTDSSART